jgi:hypothetical protein
MNMSLFKQLAYLNMEKESLIKELYNLNSACDSLKLENSDLVDQLGCKIAPQYDMPLKSRVKLDKILSFQKPYGDMWT